MNKPSFILQKIFSKNFAAIHEIKPVLAFDKSILRKLRKLRKYFIYDFHYKYI